VACTPTRAQRPDRPGMLPSRAGPSRGGLPGPSATSTAQRKLVKLSSWPSPECSAGGISKGLGSIRQMGRKRDSRPSRQSAKPAVSAQGHATSGQLGMAWQHTMAAHQTGGWPDPGTDCSVAIVCAGTALSPFLRPNEGWPFQLCSSGQAAQPSLECRSGGPTCPVNEGEERAGSAIQAVPVCLQLLAVLGIIDKADQRAQIYLRARGNIQILGPQPPA
jgi:hypothetical protein